VPDLHSRCCSEQAMTLVLHRIVSEESEGLSGGRPQSCAFLDSNSTSYFKIRESFPSLVGVQAQDSADTTHAWSTIQTNDDKKPTSAAQPSW
jgi:hypothetical protein